MVVAEDIVRLFPILLSVVVVVVVVVVVGRECLEAGTVGRVKVLNAAGAMVCVKADAAAMREMAMGMAMEELEEVTRMRRVTNIAGIWPTYLPPPRRVFKFLTSRPELCPPATQA